MDEIEAMEKLQKHYARDEEQQGVLRGDDAGALARPLGRHDSGQSRLFVIAGAAALAAIILSFVFAAFSRQ